MYTFRGDEIKLHIEYETSSEASALQWLNAEQTSGKKHPYMFSQCQVRQSLISYLQFKS